MTGMRPATLSTASFMPCVRSGNEIVVYSLAITGHTRPCAPERATQSQIDWKSSQSRSPLASNGV